MPDMRKRDMLALAERVGVKVVTWSPGDGMTRYRFIDTRSEPYWDQTYFGTSHSLYTALGLREATIWLLGYAAGVQRKYKREPLIEEGTADA